MGKGLKWNKQDEDYLVQNYNLGNLNAISTNLKRTKKAVTERAKVLGLRRDPEMVRRASHKYTINESFFSEWSDSMAYILGLIWTDGCMCCKDYSICITLHKNDKYMLDAAYTEMGSDRKPYRSANTYNLSINNMVIYRRLIELGCAERKSKTIAMPKGIPDEWLPSFIRGVLDGDGSVSVSRIRIKLSTASKEFADGLSSALNKLGINHVVYNEPYIYNGVRCSFYNVKVLRKADLKKLYGLMYTDAKLFLTRKREAFIDMGIEEEDFTIKCKCSMRRVIGESELGIIEFDSVKSAKLQFPNIDRVLSGQAPSIYRGYTWRYA